MSIWGVDTDIFGYLGSGCLTLMYLPLVYRVYHTKYTDALSTSTLVLQILTSTLFIVYGIGLPSNPIIIANGSSLACSVYLTYAKRQYPQHLPQ